MDWNDAPKRSSDKVLSTPRLLYLIFLRLYEGHFFGEMALIYDEPRVASVIAVGKTSCLYLCKAAFREALTDKQFHIMMQDISYQRVITREKREAAKLTMSSLSLSHVGFFLRVFIYSIDVVRSHHHPRQLTPPTQ